MSEPDILHEAPNALREETIDAHRAIRSLMEELEAVDWYAQRVDATDDDALKAVLAHNRDEEKEHAAMTLEWLRRRDPVFDQQLREWLFTDRPLGYDVLEGGPEEGDAPTNGDQRSSGALGIGSLFGKGTL